LKRRGVILRSAPAAALRRYSRSTSSSVATSGRSSTVSPCGAPRVPRRPPYPEDPGERLLHRAHAPRAEAGHLREPSVVRRELELLERLDAELRVQAPRQLLADPSHRRETILG
jgi:hypothetical protein